jgi:hypothetical protein
VLKLTKKLSLTQLGGKMKTIMMKMVLVLSVMFSLVLKAEDHLFTLPVIGNDIEVEHAWYYEGGGLHEAIDYTRETPGAIANQNVLAIYGGYVEMVVNTIPNGDGDNYGNYIIINHGNGYKSLYAHFMENSNSFLEGDPVYQGQIIGRVGLTGNTTGRDRLILCPNRSLQSLITICGLDLPRINPTTSTVPTRRSAGTGIMTAADLAIWASIISIRLSIFWIKTIQALSISKLILRSSIPTLSMFNRGSEFI